MMGEQKHRIVVVCGRLLVAQGIAGLLEGISNIEHVDIISNLYDALEHCRTNQPDALVIDLPAGADYFVDRPVCVGGREIKTIVLLEEEKTGRAHLYVHTPRRTANLQSLMSAILLDGEARFEDSAGGDDSSYLPALMDAPTVTPRQTSNLINARASGPKSLRISASRPEL